MKLLATDSSVQGIAADDRYAYWTSNDGDAGVVRRAPAGGGAAVTLAAGQDQPNGVAVDRANVYWANKGSGTIMKVDRCCGL
jgi:hypothetical protein